MAPHPFRGPRAAFSLVELLVVITIVASLVAVVLPAVQAARESARRSVCSNNLRQLAAGLLLYENANGRLPAAAVVSTGSNSTACEGCWNPWAEATATSFAPGTAQGTSWLLEILPFIEQQAIRDTWNRGTNVFGNRPLASRDIPGLYCASRRNGIREDRDDHLSLPDASWRGGGTDYGGCYGRLAGFEPLTADDHRFADRAALGAPRLLEGMFRPNAGLPLAAILDGLTNTLMLGELQRLRPEPGGSTPETTDHRSSQDGWAVGGVATLFTTATAPSRGNPGGIGNGYFESAGSDHPGGINVAMADGSVHFLAADVDASHNAAVYPLLGSIRDGEITDLSAATR